MTAQARYWSGRVRYMPDATTTVSALGKKRARQRAALADTTEQLAEAVRAAVAAGMTEVDVAKLAQVDRMSVRRWVGKPRKWENGRP